MGTPSDIYEYPPTRFVASFIGETNLFDGMVRAKENGKLHIQIEPGDFLVPDSDFETGEMLAVSIRPERILYSAEPVEGFNLEAVVRDQIYVGSVLKTVVELSNGNELKIERLAGQELPNGGRVYLYWKDGDAKLIHSFDEVFADAVENVVMPQGGDLYG
ncbi:MAG: TOBE domain-containing protein [Candidatus Ornithomonoglobus sp.]